MRRKSFTRLLVYDPRLPGELADRLWTDADQLLQSGSMLKDGDRTTVVRIKIPKKESANTSWLLKRYNLRGPVHTASHLLMRSRARGSWLNGRRLRLAGIATPRPMAYLENRIGPFRTRSFLLTEFVPGVPLNDVIVRRNGRPDIPDMVIQQFATHWRRLGEFRLSIGDAKGSNFLVTPDHCLWLIDLDSMRAHWSNLTFRLFRARDWKRFLQDWCWAPEIQSAFRSAVDDSSELEKCDKVLRVASTLKKLTHR